MHELRSFAQELQDANRLIYDDLLISILIKGLPLKFEVFVVGIINILRLRVGVGPDGFKDVANALLDEEQRTQIDNGTDTSSAFAARKPGGNQMSPAATVANQATSSIEKVLGEVP